MPLTLTSECFHRSIMEHESSTVLTPVSAGTAEMDGEANAERWAPILHFFLMLGTEIPGYEPAHKAARVRRFEEILRDPSSAPIQSVRVIVEKIRGNASSGEIDDEVLAVYLATLENSWGGLHRYNLLGMALNSADFSREYATDLMAAIRYLANELAAAQDPGVTDPPSEQIDDILYFVERFVRPEAVFNAGEAD